MASARKEREAGRRLTGRSDSVVCRGANCPASNGKEGERWVPPARGKRVGDDKSQLGLGKIRKRTIRGESEGREETAR